MQRQRKTNLALQQLGIRLNPHDENDKYELGEILVDILAYPTIEEAEIHRKANRLGNFDLLTHQSRLIELLNNNDSNQLQLCPCCGNIVNQSEISYTSNIDNIKVGIGVRLYFMSLIYHILIFFVGFFLYSLYALITNSNASNNSGNTSSTTSSIGLGSKLQYNQVYKNQLAIQSVLGFIYILIWGIIMANKYYKERRLQLQLKNDWLSASQFTLMIKNVPKEIINHSQEDVLKNVNDIFRDYEKLIKSKISFEVVKVNVGYPLFKQHTQQEEIRRINQENLTKKRSLFTEWLTHRRHSDYFELEQQKRTEIYENFYDFITNTYLKSDIQHVDLEDKNTIFVTLRYSKARETIEKLNRERSKIWDICTDERDDRLLFPIPNVEITKAPEPDEIKWENIGFDENVKLIRKILIFGLALVLIGVSLTINILLTGYSISNEYYVSILISLVITTINYIIEFIIILVSLYENEYIKSEEQASIGLKIAASQILNSVVVPILLKYINSQQIYATNGLVTNVFFIALINMLLPIGRFIDPFNMLLKLREKYYSSPEKRLFDLKGQVQLNKIFSFYQFQLGYQYSYIIRTSFITAFFMTVQPIIAIFAPIGLILMYLTNKYRLLYRFKKPNFHSSSVNTMLTFILKLSLVAFSLGQLYFINFQAYSIKFNLVINWISLGISIVIVLFPLQICKRYYEEPQSSGMDYNQKLLYLTTDYDRVNPVTKEDAINQFREYLQQYEKKCHLPLPDKSEMIKRSIIQIQKHDPMVSFINLREKTKTKIIHNREFLGGDMHTGERLR